MLLITGVNGQLGNCLKDILGKNGAIYTDVTDLDITNENDVRAFGATHKVTGIINCAAYTNVDKAEDEPESARRINALGPENLAKLAAEKDIPLVHISTDYVFDGSGNKPLSETDTVNPSGVYGKTKWEGEEAVLKYAKTAIILRTAWLYSPYGRNFLKTMLALGTQKDEIRVVADQFGTPTYAPHLAQVILRILPQIKCGQKETYHFTDEGSATWYDFAHYILKTAGSACCVLPIATKDYPTKAVRPSFSVLDKTKLKQDFHMCLPHWTQGVDECLKKLS
ncbi:dTDP-4-dehydrorhamnose reductase [Candidatus Avelusimicrobium fimicolum]|uniref:dTDP-4-dehydrorhamnose reductase n=1 Tax=Candidatus Avelusimicrobium fimicolum TaxID=3416216 RepID=UPI003D0DEC51